jgi:hypothetical protein
MKDLVDLFLQPAPLFERLRQRPTWLLPALVLVALAGASVYLYFSQVDPVWFIERSMLQSGEEVSDAQLEAARKAAPSGAILAWSATGGVVVSTFLMLLLTGLYLLLAGKVTGLGVSYRQGLSLASWTSLPLALGSLVTLAGLPGMDPRTPLESLSYTTVDPLLVQLPADSAWKAFATSFSLLSVWTTWLVALGWKTWSRAPGWGQAVIVALLPSVLIYGFMAARAAAG